VPEPLDLFAICAPGLSTFLAAELRDLGLPVGDVTPAGVTLRGTLADLYRANLQSRLATRIVVRIATFEATHFSTLDKRLRTVDWPRWLAPGTDVACRVTCRKSRLYHSGAVAERVQGAIAAAVRHRAVDVTDEDDDEGAHQLLLVRLDHDRCTVSLDASGALLHRRGYRQAVAKAPLRETLAAAMLRAARWDGTRPLMDPCCGSGTIPIEAALIARQMAPGRNRSFAFERWPNLARRTWQEIREAAQAAERPSTPVVIAGSDRDAGAIQSARENAARAGVEADIEFAQAAISGARPSVPTPGLVAVNPPWGARIGEADALRNLYAAIGKAMRGPFSGWDLAVLAADPRLVRQMGCPLEPKFATTAGGTNVTLSVTAPS
jgi:putative N6-adenine-specific DNA methylase